MTRNSQEKTTENNIQKQKQIVIAGRLDLTD